MKLYAKQTEGSQLAYKLVDETDLEFDIQELLDDGYKEVIDETDMSATLTGYQEYYNKWEECADCIRLYTEIVDNDPSKIQAKINSLKTDLAASDYKWRKISEAQYKGTELPYDPDELIEWSDSIRTQINELETLI